MYHNCNAFIGEKNLNAFTVTKEEGCVNFLNDHFTVAIQIKTLHSTYLYAKLK